MTHIHIGQSPLTLARLRAVLEGPVTVSLTDSARLSECAAMGQDTRALALLALGDTAAAMPYLAAFGKNSSILTPDSASKLLGSRFDQSRWRQAVDSVEAVRQGCRRRGR